MTTLECLQQGFPGMENLNCAEKILYAANIAYDLGLSAQALKLSAGFGAGMGVEAVCGTVTASCMVLSDQFVARFAHEGDTIKRLTGKLFAAVAAEMGSVECAAIKAKYRTPEDGCKYVIEKTAGILDGIIAEERREAAREA